MASFGGFPKTGSFPTPGLGHSLPIAPATQKGQAMISWSVGNDLPGVGTSRFQETALVSQKTAPLNPRGTPLATCPSGEQKPNFLQRPSWARRNRIGVKHGPLFAGPDFCFMGSLRARRAHRTTQAPAHPPPGPAWQLAKGGGQGHALQLEDPYHSSNRATCKFDWGVSMILLSMFLETNPKQGWIRTVTQRLSLGMFFHPTPFPSNSFFPLGLSFIQPPF